MAHHVHVFQIHERFDRRQVVLQKLRITPTLPPTTTLARLPTLTLTGTSYTSDIFATLPRYRVSLPRRASKTFHVMLWSTMATSSRSMSGSIADRALSKANVNANAITLTLTATRTPTPTLTPSDVSLPPRACKSFYAMLWSTMSTSSSSMRASIADRFRSMVASSTSATQLS